MAEVMACRRLTLPAEMIINYAADIHPQVMAFQEVAAGGEFDLSAVTDIDTAGLQILLLAKKRAAAAGVPLAFVSASPAVEAIFALIQREDLLVCAQ